LQFPESWREVRIFALQEEGYARTSTHGFPVHDADAEATECRLQNVGAMAP